VGKICERGLTCMCLSPPTQAGGGDGLTCVCLCVSGITQKVTGRFQEIWGISRLWISEEFVKFWNIRLRVTAHQ